MTGYKKTAFLVAIIVVLVGAAYFAVTKGIVPLCAVWSCENDDVASDSRNSTGNVSKAGSSTEIEELGIKIRFFDGYKVVKSGGETIVFFGPPGESLLPDFQNDKFHIYSLVAVEKRSSSEIIAKVNRSAEGPITLKPETKNVSGKETVRWAEGGYCENRMMEVVGPKKNYLFSSLGCDKSREYDFNYFEKTVKTLEFLP